MNETTTADYLQLPDFPLTYPAPISFVLRKLEMVRSELVRMINDGSALTDVVMSVNGKAPDESRNVSLAAADIPATEKVGDEDVQTTVQARLDNTASDVSGLSSRVTTLEGKSVEDPLVLGKAGASQAKLSSADGFSHVVPKTLDGTAFSDEATVSAGGVKLTGHEYDGDIDAAGDVMAFTSEYKPEYLFLRRGVSSVFERPDAFKPDKEYLDDSEWGNVYSYDPASSYRYISPLRFTWWASGLSHVTDSTEAIPSAGARNVARALYDSAGAIFVQPHDNGEAANYMYRRQGEVTADGVFLAKHGQPTEEGLGILPQTWVHKHFINGGHGAESHHGNYDSWRDWWPDDVGMPALLAERGTSIDNVYASLTASRLLFHRGGSDVSSMPVGGISADGVKFVDGEEASATSSLTAHGLRAQLGSDSEDRRRTIVDGDGVKVFWAQADEEVNGFGEANTEGHAGLASVTYDAVTVKAPNDSVYYYDAKFRSTSMTADGVKVSGYETTAAATTVAAGTVTCTGDGESPATTTVAAGTVTCTGDGESPTSVELNSASLDAVSGEGAVADYYKTSYGPDGMSVYATGENNDPRFPASGYEAPWITVGTEATDREYDESLKLRCDRQALIKAPGGLMLRIGSKELYLTEDKLETLSSVLLDYEAANKDLEEIA